MKFLMDFENLVVTMVVGFCRCSDGVNGLLWMV